MGEILVLNGRTEVLKWVESYIYGGWDLNESEKKRTASRSLGSKEVSLCSRNLH